MIRPFSIHALLTIAKNHPKKKPFIYNYVPSTVRKLSDDCKRF
jgi:hypothetical protein